MQSQLSWDKLFANKRERESSLNKDHRNEFDKDYDRIVASSSVRRLQDKAQVFPLQENDFTRTRLTHSLEASAIARSLGIAIEKWLIEEKKEFDKENQGKLSALLQVAGLIHDLGNPPFGHYGEDVIRQWFNKWLKSEEFEEINKKFCPKIRLKDNEKLDFTMFEGNAQTLRIVTKLQLLNDQYGANFTYGTLATIIKYPWKSSDERAKSKEKFGYFLSESSIVEKIQKATGLGDGVRHPATFLLEAADDIAYLCADIEDAVKKGIIPWNDEYNNIKKELTDKNNGKYKELFDNLDKHIENNKKNNIPDETLASIQNFKVAVQGKLISNVIDAFKENYSIIMNGTFEHKGLIDNCQLDELVLEIKKLAKKYCFVDKEVLTLELVGDTVINGLLDIFVKSLVNCNELPKAKTREGKLYSLISPNFKYICSRDYKEEKNIDFDNITLYDKLLLITDFVSGMTDSYAVNLYKELLGVKLP